MAHPHPFFLLLLALLGFAGNAGAASAYTPALAKAHAEFLKLKVSSGNTLAQQVLRQQPDNAAAILVANYGDFLTLCVQQDAKAYNKLLETQEKRLAILSKISPQNAWTDFARAELRMQIGVSKLLFGNRLSAAWDIHKAYQQYTANARRYPNFAPNKKTLGMMQVLIGSIPDRYRWFLDIIGMRGSVTQGMASLRAAATQAHPFQQEAQLLYALLQQLLDRQKDKEALQLVEQLTQQQPDNLLFRFVAMHLYKKTAKSPLALHHFEQRPRGGTYLSFPYLHHMAADLYLYRGDYARSAQENRLFLDRHKGEHYLKAANFKLYLAYLLGNHRPQALWYYKQISETGKADIEEDKYAARFVEKQQQPNLSLLKARLYSDGGYYRQALQVLDSMHTASAPFETRAEHLYRRARAYHGLEETEQAIKLYKSTISFSGTSNFYFAPNAALQLGYIYQEAGQPEQAKHYYHRAMSYEGHEYKNSIDAKAKLALSTL